MIVPTLCGNQQRQPATSAPASLGFLPAAQTSTAPDYRKWLLIAAGVLVAVLILRRVLASPAEARARALDRAKLRYQSERRKITARFR